VTQPIYILNGPNLNLLGQRQPEIYGHQTLADIEESCRKAAKTCALLINPAAYTHTSVAIYDALKTLDIPVIEIHLSQPAARESFRARSYVAQAATGTISGFGANSYKLGLQAAINLLKT